MSGFHKTRIERPDGRTLLLYGSRSVPTYDPSSPLIARQTKPNAHLRWHPFRGEWVAYAAHRQNRTFLPPASFNPLAPASTKEHPTEVPSGSWDVAVFENLFPTFVPSELDASDANGHVRPSAGTCEVVVFTQDANASLATLPLERIKLVLDVWADRTRELGRRSDVEYVMPFENRGVEVGVTLHHPHGQIYAYPFIPPVPARELEMERSRAGESILAPIVECERRSGLRIVHDADHALAWVPEFARYPFETWIAPIRRVPWLFELNDDERVAMAEALKVTLLKLDGVFSKPMPYILVVHQAPTTDESHDTAHLHIEVYPYRRMPDRLKYLAGSEMGAGAFTADSLPEDKARELARIEVDLD